MVEKSRVATKAWERVDVTKGEYMNFGRLVKEEGGDYPALIGCLKLAHKCANMGMPWLHKHPQTERV